jgi:hypothetical protein
LPTVFSQLEARFAEEEGEKWTRWYTQAPQYVGRYFVELAKGLEEQKFGKDEMLKEGLLEAADKVSSHYFTMALACHTHSASS